MKDWNQLARKVDLINPVSAQGLVSKIVGLLIESAGPRSSVGEFCHIVTRDGREIPAEVLGFRGPVTLIMPLAELEGISPGDRVLPRRQRLTVNTGPKLLGRILDGLGHPLDGRPLFSEAAYPLQNSPPNAFLRPRITESLNVGVRAIDGLLSVGRGQRMGIFAGSGV
jgi:flagellum-specific ATP synthase